MKNAIMEQAQVFASAWSLVGTPLDFGDGLDTAQQEKKALAEMVEQITSQRDELLAALEGMLAAFVEVPQMGSTSDATDKAYAAIASVKGGTDCAVDCGNCPRTDGCIGKCMKGGTK